MARHNRPRRKCRRRPEERFDRDYTSLPEYPQFTTITVIPLKTIFVNMDAAPNANDFHVARSREDKIAKLAAARAGCGAIE